VNSRVRLLLLLPLLGAPLGALDLPDVAPVTLTPVAPFEGPVHTGEVSGVAPSRQWPDVFWFHNDSGDGPRIYAHRRDGTLYRSAREADAPGVLVGGAINSDWEAMTADASGHLIIGDVGNNSNGRRDLALYYIAEPEPTAGYTPLLKTIFFRYPEQTSWPAPRDDFNYDCEGIFTKGDTVYIVTKRRSDSLTRLYRLDDPQTGRVNVLTPVADFDVRGRATGADANADGSRLVILTYDAVWMFAPATPGGDDWFAGPVWWLPYTGVRGAESVGFAPDGTILIGATERDGHLYSVSMDQLHRVR
jgi:hypothetical protein